jgi:exodeoxyribonuclease VII small subunit
MSSEQRKEPESFEQALERLEGIVAEMELGQLSLDESLARYEEAVALSRYCAGCLESAETRFRELKPSALAGTAPDESKFADSDGLEDEE